MEILRRVSGNKQKFWEEAYHKSKRWGGGGGGGGGDWKLKVGIGLSMGDILLVLQFH